jgi:hypothetical protein
MFIVAIILDKTLALPLLHELLLLTLTLTSIEPVWLSRDFEMSLIFCL